MSITRHFIPGRSLTFLLNMSEITTFEKSTFVMSKKPASYKCSDSFELPHPGTKILTSAACAAGGASPADPVSTDDGNKSWFVSKLWSWGHSAYHSKESPLPLMVKNWSQFSLLVKSPRVFNSSSWFFPPALLFSCVWFFCCFFFLPIFCGALFSVCFCVWNAVTGIFRGFLRGVTMCSISISQFFFLFQRL